VYVGQQQRSSYFYQTDNPIYKKKLNYYQLSRKLCLKLQKQK
jgi:hypothetical protein